MSTSSSAAPTGVALRPRRITAPVVRSRKSNADGASTRLVMVTAYDAPSAQIAHRAGADLLLVGDSLAMVVLGYEDTLQVTVADMAHHTAAVARGLVASEMAGNEHPRPLVVGDLPWMSFHVSLEDTVRNAAVLMRAGAGCVKIEGGRKRVPAIRAILDAEIPVMGHVGLTPQSVNSLGGFKVQGRDIDAARAVLDDAKALADAGCFAIVLEAIPDALARAITEAVDVPTIGIGAGPHCDGQVLVWHDLLGLGDRHAAKFVRRYADLGATAQEAVAAYARDVRSGAFPSSAETYASPAPLVEALLPRRVPSPPARSVHGDPGSLDVDELLVGLYGS